jgi:hypothetical protein
MIRLLLRLWKSKVWGIGAGENEPPVSLVKQNCISHRCTVLPEIPEPCGVGGKLPRPCGGGVKAGTSNPVGPARPWIP